MVVEHIICFFVLPYCWYLGKVHIVDCGHVVAFDLEAELAKQRAKEAKAEAKEKKGGERKRKGKTEDVVEKTEKPEKKKKTAPKASKDGDGSAGREADEVDPGQLRKELADAAFAKLKAAGIPEFEASELGETRKSFSIAPANKQGSTIGVVLYSESFYVYDAVSPERWESEVGTSYKVLSSFVPLLSSPVCNVNLQAISPN